MSAEKTLDEITRIVCKEKQEEIDRLKRRIESIKKEGRELCNKYTEFSNPNAEIDLFSNAHDLFDFLQ